MKYKSMMGPKNRKQNQYYKNYKTDKKAKALILLLLQSFVMPCFRIPRALFSRNTPKEYKYKRNIAIDTFGLVLFLFVLILIGNSNFLGHGHTLIALSYIAYAVIGIVVIGIVVKIFRDRKYKQTFTAQGYARIDVPFEKALRIMDNTAKWYNDENEANRELVTSLRTMGMDAEYQFKLPNGRIADARVNNILVEGKLSPNTTSEVDGLLGQLSEYTNSGYTVNVVIYGKLQNPSRTRIEDEIKARYQGRIFLTFLPNPKRQRA